MRQPVVARTGGGSSLLSYGLGAPDTALNTVALPGFGAGESFVGLTIGR